MRRKQTAQVQASFHVCIYCRDGTPGFVFAFFPLSIPLSTVSKDHIWWRLFIARTFAQKVSSDKGWYGAVALSPCRIRHCRLIPQPQVQPPNLSSELNYFCIVKSFMNIFPELHNQDTTEIFRDTCYSHSSITNSFYKNTYIIPHTLWA